MTTEAQRKEFGRDRAGYSPKPVKTQKYGDLYLDGVKILNNLPFPILQTKKSHLRKQGYTSKRVMIKYHEEMRTRI